MTSAKPVAWIYVAFDALLALYLGLGGLEGAYTFGFTHLVVLVHDGAFGYDVTPLSMLTLTVALLVVAWKRSPEEAPWLVLFASGLYEVFGSAGDIVAHGDIPWVNFLAFGLMMAAACVGMSRKPKWAPALTVFIMATFLFQFVLPFRTGAWADPPFELAAVYLLSRYGFPKAAPQA